MPGFMDSLNKGLTTINVKTSNLVESTKLKNAISSRESEIKEIKTMIGDCLYSNRNDFNMDMVSGQISEIEKKYAEIADIKDQIAKLEENAKSIIESKNTEAGGSVFCTKCGTKNDFENTFCEKCGAKLEK